MVVRMLQILLGALAVFVALGWVASLHPLLEVITNVRAQVAVIAVVPLVGFGLHRDWPWCAAAAAVLTMLVASLIPYWTASADPPVPDEDAFRVMQYNVFFGNNDFDAIAQQIIESDAHVVALHELLPEQWEGLEPKIEQAYPYRIAEPLAEIEGQPGGGMALLSRTPLERVLLPSSVSPEARVVLAATTEVAVPGVRGATLTVIGLHPHASRTDRAKVDLRDAQLDGVAAFVSENDGAAVILADLNIAPTSPRYHAFLDDLGWRDPHRVVGWKSSWPAWGGGAGMPIDHVFISDDLALHGYEMGDGAGSDHKSVTATLSFLAAR